MRSAWSAAAHQLCPRCRQGAIYRLPLWRGFLSIHEHCPVCGLKYEREPGYFLGAMYFSYLISIPPVLILLLAIWHWTHLQFDVAVLTTFVAYLPFVPAVTRWARVVWMFVDWHFDPIK